MAFNRKFLINMPIGFHSFMLFSLTLCTLFKSYQSQETLTVENNAGILVAMVSNGFSLLNNVCIQQIDTYIDDVDFAVNNSLFSNVITKNFKRFIMSVHTVNIISFISTAVQSWMLFSEPFSANNKQAWSQLGLISLFISVALFIPQMTMAIACQLEHKY